MFTDDLDEPANNYRPVRQNIFGSFAPSALPRRLWLALCVIAIIGMVGLAFIFMH